MVVVALTGIVGMVAIVAIVFGRPFQGWFGKSGVKLNVGSDDSEEEQT